MLIFCLISNFIEHCLHIIYQTKHRSCSWNDCVCGFLSLKAGYLDLRGSRYVCPLSDADSEICCTQNGAATGAFLNKENSKHIIRIRIVHVCALYFYGSQFWSFILVPFSNIERVIFLAIISNGGRYIHCQKKGFFNGSSK